MKTPSKKSRQAVPPPAHSRVEIGKRLRALQRALQAQSRTIHQQTGIGESTWSQYRNGSRFPEVLAILPLCDRYGITLDYIYRGIVAGLPHDIGNRIVVELQRIETEGNTDSGATCATDDA